MIVLPIAIQIFHRHILLLNQRNLFHLPISGFVWIFQRQSITDLTTIRDPTAQRTGKTCISKETRNSSEPRPSFGRDTDIPCFSDRMILRVYCLFYKRKLTCHWWDWVQGIQNKKFFLSRIVVSFSQMTIAGGTDKWGPASLGRFYPTDFLL